MNLEELQRAVKAGSRFKYLFFWGHRKRSDGALTSSCFSQWYTSSFEVEGHRYPTAEHFMMAEKARLFEDEESLESILAAPNPGAAKRFGRGVKRFDENTWREHRFGIVVRASVAKFDQNPELRAYLLGTGERVLVEASPVDRIWGIGLAADDKRVHNPLQWRGENLLGFALMEARGKIGGASR
ncbi:MAG: NADAR family protein [Myxococcota bacterium]